MWDPSASLKLSNCRPLQPCCLRQTNLSQPASLTLCSQPLAESRKIYIPLCWPAEQLVNFCSHGCR